MTSRGLSGRRALILTAAILAAVFLWLLATLPPQPATTTASVGDEIRRRTMSGAFHVHSARSDGSEGRDAIAAAASRAGLQFVVMTDHGDGTREPDPPAYVHGVLMLDAVEISTNGGHYVAVGMPASPYPLGGEADAVVEDVRRLGGFGIVAHGDSPKTGLQWTDWNLAIDGIEWLNLDSEWRDEPRHRLPRLAFDYLFRKGPALASILDRPVSTLDRWDAIAARTRLVGLSGHDAHGGWSGQSEEGSEGGFPGIPSYVSSFRTLALRAVLEQKATGHPDQDAGLLLNAFRSGRLFTAIDAVASPAWVDYTATSGTMQVSMGEALPFAEGATVTFRSSFPQGGRLALYRDGAKVAEAHSGELRATAGGPGSYRVEVAAPRAPGTPPVPWIVTNPIYLVGQSSDGVGEPVPDYTSVLALSEPGRLEKDPESLAQLDTADARRVVQYRLRAGDRVSQYVALSLPMPQTRPAFDAVVFDARAAAPMRVSVQLRFNELGGARWGSSVYLSPETRRIALPLEKLVSLDRVPTRPQMATASSMLFVVDLTNAKPGWEGRFEISDLSLASTSRSAK